MVGLLYSSILGCFMMVCVIVMCCCLLLDSCDGKWLCCGVRLMRLMVLLVGMGLWVMLVISLMFLCIVRLGMRL